MHNRHSLHRTDITPSGTTDPDFAPDFADYNVVISNFGWKAADWAEGTQKALEAYMKAGGGFVSVHGADNSFPKWKAYNKMIGLRGWGGRNQKDGPYIYYNHDGEGRVFHTTLGHDTPAFEGVGFIVSFTRGCEWAATGIVKQPIPKDFPTAEVSSTRSFELK